MLLFVAVLFYGAYRVATRMAQNREHKMLDAALELGFSFGASGESLEMLPFVRLPLFARYGSRSFSNVMRGKVGGREVVVFDYFGADARESSTRHTLACFELPGASLPEFSLQPGSPLHSVGLRLFGGYRDINFEHMPAFSQTYLLFGPDEAAVRELFERGPVAFFEKNCYWRAEGGGDWLILGCYKTEFGVGHLDPAGLPDFLEKAVQIADIFAGHARPSSAPLAAAAPPTPPPSAATRSPSPSGGSAPAVEAYRPRAASPGPGPAPTGHRPAPPRLGPPPTFESEGAGRRQLARVVRTVETVVGLFLLLLFALYLFGRACS